MTATLPASPALTDEPELCPFDCDNHGGHPVISGPYGGFQVSCNACNACGPIESTEALALKSWNRRHRSSPSAEWRAIDTAPKDGRQVLVSFDGRAGRALTIVRWIDSQWRVGRDDGGIAITLAANPPTHWFPALPEPPK